MNQLRLGRHIHHYADQLSVPRSITARAVKGLKRVLRPDQVLLRRQYGRRLLDAVPRAPHLDPTEGYTMLPRGELPNVGPAVNLCRDIYEDRNEAARAEMDGHMTNLLQPSDLVEHEELRELVLGAEPLAMATEYLGSLPRLPSLMLLWTPENETEQSSQLYHRDQIDLRQAKFFVAIKDVDEDCGPFTFFPADVSQQIAEKADYEHGRLDDEEVERHTDREPLQFIAERGDAVAVDTSRCFHYGGRSRGGDRLMLMFHFIDYHSVLESSQPLEIDGKGLYPGDRIRQLILS